MIPKIIHHVWPGNDPFKEKFYNFRLSWMKHHSDWTFYFWRLDNLPDEFNPEIKKALLDSNFAITPKSDMLRFEILRIFGGIYVDTDMECLKSFDELRKNSLFAGYEDNNGTICPSVIGTIKNNQIITELTTISLKNALSVGYELSNTKPHKITGVKPFTDIINQNLSNVVVYPKHYFYHISYTERDKLNNTHPEAFAKHYWSGKDKDGWTKTIKFSD
jgi:mannosyltransferase OCH1-like enzyme